MLFIKAPGKPGQAWHQDEAHIPTRDRSLTAVWIALDDATVDNGCLWVVPGSHRRGVLHPVRDHGDDRFDCTPEAYGFTDERDAVAVELAAGDALCLQRVRRAPLAAEHNERRPSPGTRQPLHERRIGPAVVPADDRGADGNARPPRHRHGRRRRPVRGERDDRRGSPVPPPRATARAGDRTRGRPWSTAMTRCATRRNSPDEYGHRRRLLRTARARRDVGAAVTARSEAASSGSVSTRRSASASAA